MTAASTTTLFKDDAVNPLADPVTGLDDAATALAVSVLAKDPAIRAAVMATMTTDDVHAVMDRIGHCCECRYFDERERQQEAKRAADIAARRALPNWGQRWTQDQLDVLREPWLTDEECARVLGRTVAAVESARNVYKIYPGREVVKAGDHPERQRALRKYAEQLAARPKAIQ